MLDGGGIVVWSQAGSKDFSVHLSIHTASYLTAAGGIHLGVKHIQCESDHPQLPIAEVKNAWSYTSNLPYAFMDCTEKKLHIYFGTDSIINVT
jgi:hypothetical protein